MKKRTPRFLFNSGLAIKNVRDDIHRTAARYREWRVQNLSAIVISEESPPKKTELPVAWLDTARFRSNILDRGRRVDDYKMTHFTLLVH